MLMALEQGVKGGVWFSWMDKVYAPANLVAAFGKVASNRGSAGVDHVTIRRFAAREAEELARLREHLRTGQYQPQAVRRAWIPKGQGALRPLGIPTVRDRVVQTALRNVLEPIFEREFAEHSYGFRPGRSAKDALRRVDRLLRDGHRYVVDADIRGYFDSIPKGPLMRRVEERVADGRVLDLLTQYLNQPVLEDLRQWTPEQGTPQGAVISPLLANLYLNPLDHAMVARGFEMVRYADDFVVLCRTRDEAAQALGFIREWMEQAGLTLHPEKTRIADIDAGQFFDFLGYRFKHQEGKGDQRYPRPKSMGKLRDRIREKTHRCNGLSLANIIVQVNPILRGWFEYFKHSHYTVFPEVDGWVRMRLRSILRKRQKRKGRGRGADHQRWPNQYFADQGLLCLRTAHGRLRQSHSG
jgi:RNA-directed DNA polymerase